MLASMDDEREPVAPVEDEPEQDPGDDVVAALLFTQAVAAAPGDFF